MQRINTTNQYAKSHKRTCIAHNSTNEYAVHDSAVKLYEDHSIGFPNFGRYTTYSEMINGLNKIKLFHLKCSRVKMTTTLYYALWYYCDIYGARSAYAISKNRQNLIPLHEENVKKESSQGINEIVSEIKITPIECYTYNIKTKEIEPYQEFHRTDSHQFYAFSTMLCVCTDRSFFPCKITQPDAVQP